MSHGYTYPSSFVNQLEQQNRLPSDPNVQNCSNFIVNQVLNNSSIAQLRQEMQDMKATINNLTLTDKALNNIRNTQQPKQTQHHRGDGKNLNPKTGLPWKRYC